MNLAEITQSYLIPKILILLIFLVFLFVLTVKAYKNRVRTGKEGLINEVAVVTKDIKETGKVFIDGEIWEAASSEKLKKGEKVVIISVEGMLLNVEKYIKE